MKVVNFSIKDIKADEVMLTQWIRISYMDGKEEKMRTKTELMVRITFDWIINWMVWTISKAAKKRFIAWQITKPDLKYVKKFNESYWISINEKDVIEMDEDENIVDKKVDVRKRA